MSDTVVICSDSESAKSQNPDLILSEELRDISKSRADDLFGELQSLNLDDKRLASAYHMISTQVWKDTGGLHDHSPRSLELLPILYKKIEREISPETDKIICIGVSGRYLDLVRDLAENNSLILETCDIREETKSDRMKILNSLLWLFISLFDGVFTLLLKPLFKPTNSDLLVKYPVFRPDTIGPVEGELDISFDATITLLTVSYFIKRVPDIGDSTSLIPVRCFSGLRQMALNYRFVAYVLQRTILNNTFKLALVDSVEDITGVRLERTISRLLLRAVLSNIGTLLYSGTFQMLFKTGEYKQVLVTSTGPSGRGVAFPAIKAGIEPYILHHSIVTPREPFDTSYPRRRFCEGSVLKKALNDSENDLLTPITVGLPKHLDIAEKNDNPTAENVHNVKDGKTILIGTQPFDDPYRKQFIMDILPPLLNGTKFNMIIKIHPAENKNFYVSLLEELGSLSNSSRVKIKDSNLYQEIRRSDILLTVSSNVALESVILGTPTAVYNPWSPNFRNPLYVTYGPVPHFTDTNDLISLLTKDNLDDLLTEERAMLNELYMVRDNSIDKLVQRINTELSSLKRD